MESNKSKGVRNVPEKIYLQVGIWDPSEDESYDFSKLAGNGGVTWCADRIDETDIEYSLAHPQQSEGVEEIERYKQWVADLQSGMYVNCVYCGHRYGREDETPVAMADVLKAHIEQCPEHPLSKALARIKELESKAEGVGATDSICGDLKDRQAAEGQSPEDYNEAWMDVINIIETDNCHALVGYDETLAKLKAKGYRLVSQPSEPAALKEFYCIGDKDNLFQCEEQCEDCKKGAALKDGEIEKIVRQVWNKYSDTTWVVPPDKFTAALKEFASLLNQKR